MDERVLELMKELETLWTGHEPHTPHVKLQLNTDGSGTVVAYVTYVILDEPTEYVAARFDKPSEIIPSLEAEISRLKAKQKSDNTE